MIKYAILCSLIKEFCCFYRLCCPRYFG